MLMRFKNRTEAGQLLAKRLDKYAHCPGVLVLALPRGGVPVAFEIARALNSPLDVFVVRKLGVPGQEELAMGALASGDVRVINHGVVAGLNISDDVIDEVTERELHELQRRELAYRHHRPPPEVEGRTVILVDDGIATGSTMKAAIRALRHVNAGRVVVAVPTAAPSAARELKSEVDDWVSILTPVDFMGVGQWYEDFSQTTDAEVRDLLERSARPLNPT